MYEMYITSHSPIFRTPEQYVKAKLKIWKRDFYIEPTEAEIEHIKTLKNQTQIDNAFQSLITRRWG